MKIDLDKLKDGVIGILKKEVQGYAEESSLDAKLLAQLGRQMTEYWVKDQMGEEGASIELDHITATMALITAKLSVRAASRVNKTLMVILETGAIALKAIL